ncbi:MAG: HNH endonuclease signature motif containing protein [Patescibacteria group bacterium]
MQIQEFQTTQLPKTKVCNPSEKSNYHHETNSSEQAINLPGTNPSEKFNHLHQKFVEYGRNAKEWMRKCVLLLPEIEKYKVWKKKGFSCIYEYTAKLAGMSRDSVDEALRVLKKISDKPILLKIVEEKGLQRVRPIATIATVENQKFWAEKANSMSKNALETYVKDYRSQFLPREAAQSVNQQENYEALTMNLKPETVSKLKKMHTGNWDELMQKFIKLYEKNLEQELEQEKPAPATDTSSHIPKKIQNYVLKRSHGKCEFPNCTRDYKHLHHTNRYSSNKIHDPDQIVALCEAHHDLAHRGLIDNEDQEINTWRILKEPDYTNLNWYIDQQIATHRR